ncbi:hypothetical protein [Pseudarthrobacter chlorophenolicus]|uniref:hypothetical protein n=1 Tax=Pseudarthrobacter chlorophenolicus TaxID=85085 RepID=UPI0005F2B9B3|nr:hypothetical protein [Pseudarthrobacter chlorophenolicus]
MGERNTPEDRMPSKLTKWRAAVVPLLALAVVLAGCLIAWLNRNASFSFAYAPNSNRPFTGIGADLITEGAQAGLAIAVVGLLALAFWAGFRMGRRPGRQAPPR